MPMANAPYFPEMPVGGAMPMANAPYFPEMPVGGAMPMANAPYFPEMPSGGTMPMVPYQGGAGVPLQSASTTQPQAGGLDPNSMAPSWGIAPDLRRFDLSGLAHKNRLMSDGITKMFDERSLYDFDSYMAMLEDQAARRAAGGYWDDD